MSDHVPRKRVAHCPCGSLRADTLGEPVLVAMCSCEAASGAQEPRSQSAHTGKIRTFVYPVHQESMFVMRRKGGK